MNRYRLHEERLPYFQKYKAGDRVKIGNDHGTIMAKEGYAFYIIWDKPRTKDRPYSIDEFKRE